MIIKENITISIYNLERTLHIYVPDHLHGSQRCGVIYMFDGHNLFEDETATYGKSWGLNDYLMATQLPVIVVGLECNHEGNQRLCEFSPYNFKDRHWGTIKASGKALVRWMVDELKPMIDANLPTLPDRDHTAVGGSSMGGLMALYAGAAASNTFSRAICISPYHAHVMGPLIRDLKKKIHPNTQFYLSWGGNELPTKRALATYTEANLKIARTLMPQAEVALHLYPNQDHSEASWEKETDIWMSEMGIKAWQSWS